MRCFFGVINLYLGYGKNPIWRESFKSFSGALDITVVKSYFFLMARTREDAD